MNNRIIKFCKARPVLVAATENKKTSFEIQKDHSELTYARYAMNDIAFESSQGYHQQTMCQTDMHSYDYDKFIQ